MSRIKFVKKSQEPLYIRVLVGINNYKVLSAWEYPYLYIVSDNQLLTEFNIFYVFVIVSHKKIFFKTVTFPIFMIFINK